MKNLITPPKEGGHYYEASIVADSVATSIMAAYCIGGVYHLHFASQDVMLDQDREGNFNEMPVRTCTAKLVIPGPMLAVITAQLVSVAGHYAADQPATPKAPAPRVKRERKPKQPTPPAQLPVNVVALRPQQILRTPD